MVLGEWIVTQRDWLILGVIVGVSLLVMWSARAR